MKTANKLLEQLDVNEASAKKAFKLLDKAFDLYEASFKQFIKADKELRSLNLTGDVKSFIKSYQQLGKNFDDILPGLQAQADEE